MTGLQKKVLHPKISITNSFVFSTCFPIMLKSYYPRDVCRLCQVSLVTCHGTDAAPALGGFARPRKGKLVGAVGPQMGWERRFIGWTPVKASEISLILFNLEHLKNLSGNFQALVLVLIEKSSHSWMQEQRSVHLNRAVPLRSSTAGFCPWSSGFNGWKSLDPAVYMGVSKNRGTPKWMVYNGTWMIWGAHPYFWKHPHEPPFAFLTCRS